MRSDFYALPYAARQAIQQGERSRMIAAGRRSAIATLEDETARLRERVRVLEEALRGINDILNECIKENDGPNRLWIKGVPHEGPAVDFLFKALRGLGECAEAALSSTEQGEG